MQRSLMSTRSLILIGFILVKFILQYILLSASYDLQRDEYLYLDQANHLAWGYLSVPPVTSRIAIIISLLGNSIVWVKFFPALFGALTLLVVWKTIEELKGNIYALLLGATCVLLSALLRLNTLFQPNSLDVLMWTLFYFTVVKYFSTEKSTWLYIAASVFALGFLNKYNIAFLAIGLVPALLLTKSRHVFLIKEAYLAALLSLLLILPNLIWQYNNNFPVLHHLNQLTTLQLVNVNRVDFLKTQLLFFTGGLPVILAACYALIFYKPFEKYRFFALSIIFTLVVFTYLRAKDYYAIGLYPIYIAFGSVFLEVVLKTGWKKYVRAVIIALPVIIFILIYDFAFPNKTPEYILAHPQKYKSLGMLRWEDGKDHSLPQDFADMLGWKELATKVDSVYALSANPKKILVLCDNYGQAGAINYYSTKGIQAVSFNADYVNWFDLSNSYTDLIRVKERSDRDDELKETAPYFQSAIIADSITNKHAREYGTLIFSFKGARINIVERIQAEIEEVKNYSK